ncbi:MAG: hypothetical protein J2P19_01545 [Pseudonocardia sp.]|nr:hypothetical protein [Pseudonocardia sp.]
MVIGLPDDGWADAYADGTTKLRTVWDADGMLDASVTAPWGTIPGRAALC